MTTTVEMKLDALIEALGFETSTQLNYEETEISEQEGHSIIESHKWRPGNYTLVVDQGMGSALKRGKDNSYFRALRSPEVTFTLKKRV